MAAWALGMLIVTCWLTVITLLGILFVWRTLVAARDTVDATREVGDNQIRPYVFCKGVSTPNESTAIAAFKIHNAGQSPAELVKIDYDFYQFSDGAEINARVPQGGLNLMGSIFPNSSVSAKSGLGVWCGGIVADEVVQVRGRVSYFNPIHERNEFSPFLFISKRGSGEFSAHSPDGIYKYDH